MRGSIWGLPDASRWEYDVGLIRNQERQHYTRGRAENARVENGVLVIEARREPYENAEYTSPRRTRIESPVPADSAVDM